MGRQGQITGRRRRPLDLRLEDKTTIDGLWAALGLPHLPSRVVPTTPGALAAASAALDGGHGVVWAAEATVDLRNGDEAAEILLLQGLPIGEPVAHHGPFVMNSRDELQQAFIDYQRTGYGGWQWPAPGPVHPRDAGRFARFPDGRVENGGTSGGEGS